MIKGLNAEPERIKLEWFSTSELADLTTAINDHVKELEKVGPIKKISASKIAGD
jgi:coenzyme F420-reducing hydrogenase delta subunit